MAQDWREATFTIGYEPNQHLEFLAETRRDWSNVSSFVDSNGITSSTNQESVALDGIVKF